MTTTATTLSLPQLINQIEIASPCDARWEDMIGDERSRRCEDCQLEVHNLEAMTPEEIRDVILNAEGRICGRVRRRMDGTVITRDCPVGLARIRRAAAKSAIRIASAAVFVIIATVWFARAALALKSDSLATIQDDAWRRTKTWLGQSEQQTIAFPGMIAPTSPMGGVRVPQSQSPTPADADGACDSE